MSVEFDVNGKVKRDRCTKCGQGIIWVEGPTGKPNPIDTRAFPDGNITLALVDGKVTATWLRKDSPPSSADAKRFKNHFATCPNAKDFRGGYRRG